MNLDKLMIAIASVANAKQDADPTAQVGAAIGRILVTLRAALNGELLRGLPNLGTTTTPFHGLNVRAWDYDHKIPFPDEDRDHGADQLVLTVKAELKIVHAYRREPIIGNIGMRRIDPWFEFSESWAGRLQYSDLARLVEILPGALELHVNTIQRESLLAREAGAVGAKLEDALRRIVPGSTSKKGR